MHKLNRNFLSSTITLYNLFKTLLWNNKLNLFFDSYPFVVLNCWNVNLCKLMAYYHTPVNSSVLFSRIRWRQLCINQTILQINYSIVLPWTHKSSSGVEYLWGFLVSWLLTFAHLSCNTISPLTMNQYLRVSIVLVQTNRLGQLQLRGYRTRVVLLVHPLHRKGLECI